MLTETTFPGPFILSLSLAQHLPGVLGYGGGDVLIARQGLEVLIMEMGQELDRFGERGFRVRHEGQFNLVIFQPVLRLQIVKMTSSGVPLSWAKCWISLVVNFGLRKTAVATTLFRS